MADNEIKDNAPVKELKGKKAKTAKAKKAPKEPKKQAGSIPNFGCCCTCKHYPEHKKGCAQPCSVLKNYVARKAQHPECYACKFN